jgi:nicotinamidase-related amidase
MAVWDDLLPESDRKMFEKAGMGRLGGLGKKPVVIVVDMTCAFVDERFPLGSPTGPAAAKAIKDLLEVARSKKVPIVYSTGAHREREAEKGRRKSDRSHPLDRAPEAHTVWPEIAPQADDVVIVKHKPSVFFSTPLESYLTYWNVDTTIITGMVTSGCVRATVVDAFSYNYYVVIPEECVADRGDVSHRISLFDMQMKYANVLPLAQVKDYIKGLA